MNFSNLFIYLLIDVLTFFKAQAQRVRRGATRGSPWKDRYRALVSHLH